MFGACVYHYFHQLEFCWNVNESSSLLSIQSYCTQMLTSPTREARGRKRNHTKREWKVENPLKEKKGSCSELDIEALIGTGNKILIVYRNLWTASWSGIISQYSENSWEESCLHCLRLTLHLPPVCWHNGMSEEQRVSSFLSLFSSLTVVWTLSTSDSLCGSFA